MKFIQLAKGVFTSGFAAAFMAALLALGAAENSSARVIPAGHSTPAESQTKTNASAGTAGMPSPTALLDQIRSSAEQVLANLTNFACSEQIDRYRGSARKAAGRKLDVVTAKVSYSSASEHYSEVRENDKPLTQIGALSGAWSAGEYGTILGQTVKALRSRAIRFLAFTPLDGRQAAVYRFDYTAEDSPWDINVAGIHYALPFHAQVWASPTTGEILRIDRIAYNVPEPTGIAAVNWAVMFGPSQADGKTFLLPARGVYSVSYLNSDRHEWNEIAFSDYKRFSTESVVHFR